MWSKGESQETKHRIVKGTIKQSIDTKCKWHLVDRRSFYKHLKPVLNSLLSLITLLGAAVRSLLLRKLFSQVRFRLFKWLKKSGWSRMIKPRNYSGVRYELWVCKLLGSLDVGSQTVKLHVRAPWATYGTGPFFSISVNLNKCTNK